MGSDDSLSVSSESSEEEARFAWMEDAIDTVSIFLSGSDDSVVCTLPQRTPSQAEMIESYSTTAFQRSNAPAYGYSSNRVRKKKAKLNPNDEIARGCASVVSPVFELQTKDALGT